MPDPISTSINYGVNVGRDLAASGALGAHAQAAGQLETQGQATEAIARILGGWGLQKGVLATRLRDHLFGQLGLDGRGGDPQQAATPETRRFVAMALGLQRRAGLSDGDRIQFALLWAGLPKTGGARQALEKLGGCAAFWKTATQGERARIAEVLAQPARAKHLPALATSYAHLLQHPLFGTASAKGRSSALAQPLRASKLLSDLKRLNIELPTDDSQARAQVLRYVKYASGYNTPEGQAALTQQLLERRERLLAIFFEEIPSYRKLKGESVWFGELYEKVGYDSWTFALHKYGRKEIDLLKCFNEPDRGPHCLPPKPHGDLRPVTGFGQTPARP